MTAIAQYDGDSVPTLITDVAVFESAAGTVDGPFDVYLNDGKITAVRAAGDMDWRARTVLLDDAVLVDGGGRTLLPGLIDVHVHLGSMVAVPGKLRIPDPFDNAAAFAYCGVTTVVDLATPMAEIARLRRRIDSGRAVGPSIYATGKPFSAPGGHPESSVERMFPSAIGRFAARHMTNRVATAEDVDEALTTEPVGDAIKVMFDSIPPGSPEISDEALERLTFAASALGKPVFAHVGRSEDVDRALAHGVSALMHLPYAAVLSPAQQAQLVALFIPAAPTLAVWDAVGGLASGHVYPTDLGREVLTPRQERDLADPLAHAPLDDEMGAWAKDVAAHRSVRLAGAKSFADAGGRVLVGSDTPFLSEPAGAGLHHELDLLQEAGLTPGEVLRAATWGNRTFLDPQGKFGAIVEGWQADLLMVEGNPVVDPEAMHAVVDVWIDGRRVVRRPGGR